MSSSSITIYGPDGEPAESKRGEVMTRDKAEAVVRSYTGYLRALHQLDHEPTLRTREPFTNHAWVYAAAMARSLNLAQAPFGVFAETEQTVQKRRLDAIAKQKRRGEKPKWHGPKRGLERTAVQRHLTRSANPGRFRGFRSKHLEEDLDHPLNMPLHRPNVMHSGSMLWQITELFMALRGEAFWLLFGSDPTQRLAIGSVPASIWPVPPQQMTEVKVGNRLIGWTLGNTSQLTGSEQSIHAAGIFFRLEEVIHFKYYNPMDPVRGLSPLTAAAMSIDLDLQAKALNRSMLKHGSRMGDILAYEGELDEDEQEDAAEKFEKRHKGANKAGRLRVLSGEWKYIPTGLSQSDMEYLDMMRWGRDEIFAIMRVPKTVVGITEEINFATQLGQDKNFWDKGLLPDVRLFEDTLDQTLFFNQPDDVVGMFDLANVEALRAGMEAQINQAKSLTGTELHMPPRDAFDLVGLPEVGDYEGSDVCLISGLATMPVSAVLEAGTMVPEEPGNDDSEAENDDQEDAADQDDEPAPPNENAFGSPEIISGGVKFLLGVAQKSRLKQRGGKIWQNFIAAQTIAEKKGRTNWRSWVGEERRRQLEKFDDVLRTDKMLRELRRWAEIHFAAEGDVPAGDLPPAGITPDDILLDIKDSKARLSTSYRSVYTASVELAFEVTVEELGGIAVFDINDGAIQRAIRTRESALIKSVPRTVQKNLRKSLADGLRNGETKRQLRERVNQQYNFTASSGKTLTVARTETAGMMNSSREEMFDLAQLSRFSWVTAGDEVVRPSHVWLGQVDPQDKGTDYSKLEGFPGDRSGILEYPGDARGAAKEVINCRCVKIALA